MEEDTTPWYALQLFGCRPLKVKAFFEEKGLECFVPMQWKEVQGMENKVHRKLTPVVNNLLFVKKTVTAQEMAILLLESGLQMRVMTKSRDNKEYYEIPSDQMREFRIMCNPDIYLREYLTPDEAQLKPGIEVEVTHGPLKGLTGRLVRKDRRYFLLKEVPGMGVMLKVTRWCCTPRLPKP